MEVAWFYTFGGVSFFLSAIFISRRYFIRKKDEEFLVEEL